MVLFNYNGNLALESRWLWESGVMSEKKYYYHRKKLNVLNNKGCRSNNAIISYNSIESLPYNIKSKVDSKLEALGEFPTVKGLSSVDEAPKPSLFESYIKDDAVALDFFSKHDGEKLTAEKVQEHYLNAKILNAFHDLLTERTRWINAKGSGKLKRKSVFVTVLGDLKLLNTEKYPHTLPLTERNLRPKYKQYIAEGYRCLLHGNDGNQHTRIVTDRTENLLLALHRGCDEDAMFKEEVHAKYIDFIYGNVEFYDKDTGEMYKPEDFYHNGKPRAISQATVWNYLEGVVNSTATYADRLGNFDYMNKMHPKVLRKSGEYSLSKVSMDDSAMSRKIAGGWVNRYHAFDVVSGYWFRPVYCVRRKPTIADVEQVFRNMFCEVELLGMAVPGEIDVERFLMKDIAWLSEVFPFVTFNKTASSKRAEHSIKSLKYGVSHKNKHTRGRWYAKKEGYKSIRYKVDGDFVQTEYNPQTIIMDDLSDIDEHNNSLHPNQGKYAGMTRRDVFLSCVNPNLAKYEKRLIYKHIANETKNITIYNNDVILLNNGQYCLENYDMLDKLKPNNYKVDAYWLPNDDGYVSEAFLYQNEIYIGRVFNKNELAYNECKVEQTEDDLAKQLEQFKRNAQFSKKIKDRRSPIPKIFERDRIQVEELQKIILSDNDYIVQEAEQEECAIYEHNPERVRELAYAI